MFGVVLTALAVLGLVLAWRRPGARLLALAWLGAAALAIGPVLWIGGHAYAPAARMLDGARVSAVLPYTWFVQIPGLSGFREAGWLGNLPAAVMPATYRVATMPTALPALDRPVAASSPGSIVVDFRLVS